MQGLHLTADLYQCAADTSLLIDAATLSAMCRDQTQNSGLTLVAEKWHTFPDYQGEPGGVTGMLLLAESHLAIHTWPERGGVTLDVYVCNFEGDNTQKAEQLMATLEQAFQPGKAQHNRLQRGERDGPVEPGMLLLEDLNETSVYGFRFERQLLSSRTAYQQLELLDSRDLGTTLRLDGHMMTSEADEFFYHEALVHPATVAHPAPRSALIVGGGDGGALEELLKHPLESVTLIELDAGVVDVARQHLQSIHRGAFDDPRVSVCIEDGAAFVASTAQRFDLVFLDLTDPETPAGPLYTEDFFLQCKSILAPGGALVLHLGAPFYKPAQVQQMNLALSAVFAQVHGYGLHIPLYGAYWALAVCSDVLNPRSLDAASVQERLKKRGVDLLQYYNPEVHGALFALPTFHRKLLDA